MPANSYILTITNPGAETGTTSGWTTNSTFTVRTASPSPRPGGGIYYFYGGDANALSAAWQDLSITNNSANNDIDAGNVKIGFSWWQAAFDAIGDTGTISIHFRDAVGGTISNIVLPAIIASASWQQREYYGNSVPVGTRTVRVQMNAIRVSGTNNDAYFDDLSNVTLFVGPDANVTTEYVEFSTNTKTEAANVSTEYFEVSTNTRSEAANVSTEYFEVSTNTRSEAANVTIQYAEITSNASPPEPRITIEYAEIASNAVIASSITAEYAEVGLAAISRSNVTAEYAEVGLAAISRSNVTTEYAEIGLAAISRSNVTTEYVEISTNTSSSLSNVSSEYAEIAIRTGTGNANVLQYYVQVQSGLNIQANANVSFLSSEIMLAPPSMANANVLMAYAEVIVIPLRPQVLVAGI